MLGGRGGRAPGREKRELTGGLIDKIKGGRTAGR